QDADFNETLATFVGNQGSLEYFSVRFGPGDERLGRAFDADQDDKIFAKEVAELRSELTAIYSSPLARDEKLAQKARMFEAFRERYRTVIKPKLKTSTYDYHLREDLNNAWILGLERYHGDLESFAKLHKKL